jgi:zinc protease
MIELLAEVALRPSFPENEIDLYRRNTIEHLKFQRSQPGFLAGEQAARLIYGEHPYSRVSPKAADIAGLNRNELVSHHRRTFIPNNAIFVAVGDVDALELFDEIDEHFGSWVKGEIFEMSTAEPPRSSSRSLTIVDRPGSAQSNIVLGNLAAKRLVPDHFALIVMNQVLGAGASSRVFMNLREEKGYTYGAYTRVDAKRLSGDLEATAEVRTAVTGDSLKEFFYELDRVRAEKVTDKELDDAKRFLTGVFPIRAETQEGLTNLILTQQLYGLPDDHLQTYRQHVNAVTADDVLSAAQKYVRPDEMAIVIVGDAQDVLGQARGFAPSVEIFDTEGKEMDVSSYEGKSDEPANAAGEWKLLIDFQGQKMPVTLNLAQDGDAVTGELETMLGNGEIADGKVSGNKMTATAKTDMQGQSVEFAIIGKIDGDDMSGTITAPIVPDPLPFTGGRS